MFERPLPIAISACIAAAIAPTAIAAAPPHDRADPLAAAVRSPTRSATFTARDTARHPEQVLRFFGITPRSHVIEVWPGTGYWTQILAPLTAGQGRYTAALGWAGGNEAERYFATPPAELSPPAARRAARFREAMSGTLAAGRQDLGAPGSADAVLTFRNLHNWVASGTAPQMLAAIHRVLRPGGVLGIEDHRARPDRPQDPKAADGYLRQDYAIALVEKAGFRLVGRSEILANPRDTTHWPKGVWTLPPTYALGAVDRAKYRAVGEADNFLLKFRRIG